MQKQPGVEREVWYLVNREPFLTWPEVEERLTLDPETAADMYLAENREYVWESWKVAFGRTLELFRNYRSVLYGESRLRRK